MPRKPSITRRMGVQDVRIVIPDGHELSALVLRPALIEFRPRFANRRELVGQAQLSSDQNRSINRPPQLSQMRKRTNRLARLSDEALGAVAMARTCRACLRKAESSQAYPSREYSWPTVNRPARLRTGASSRRIELQSHSQGWRSYLYFVVFKPLRFW